MSRILTLTLNPALDLTVQLRRLEAGQVNRSDVMHTHAAGKGVNVAQVLADLGHQLTVSGFLGEDNLQAFETLFAKRGFVDAFIRVPGETRSNIKLAESDGRITDINGPGPQVGSSTVSSSWLMNWRTHNSGTCSQGLSSRLRQVTHANMPPGLSERLTLRIAATGDAKNCMPKRE